MLIESVRNQQVKRLRSLATKKGRRTHRQFLVEGVRALEEAAEGCLEPETIVLCPELATSSRAEELADQLAATGAEMLQMSEEAFRAFSQVQSPEGVAAAIRIPERDLESLPTGAALFVGAVDLRDPGNMGALARTADAAGAGALIAAGSCADIYDPKVVRATAGSIFHLPVVIDLPAERLLEWARSSGISTVAAHMEDARPHTQIRYKPRTLVLVGNEANGLSPELASRADHRAYIPMPGRAESLNVTVAAGILVWEILRRRGVLDDYNQDGQKDRDGEK